MDKAELERLSNLTGALNAILGSTEEKHKKYVVDAQKYGHELEKLLLELNEKTSAKGSLSEKKVDAVLDAYSNFRTSLKAVAELSVRGNIGDDHVRFNVKNANDAEIHTIKDGKEIVTNLKGLGITDVPRSASQAELGSSEVSSFMTEPPKFKTDYTITERSAYKNLEKYLKENGNGNEEAKKEMKALLDDLKQGPSITEEKIDKHMQDISKKAGVNYDIAKDRFIQGIGH